MQKVQRLGRKRTTWLAVPLAVCLTVAVFVLWPTSPQVSVLVANRDIASGTQLKESDFTPVAIPATLAGNLYPSSLPKRANLFHRLAKGQLLPRTSIATEAFDVRLPTVIETKQPLSNKLRVGSSVNIWATTPSSTATSDPVAIALGCEIAGIAQDTTLGQKLFSVEVLCEPEFFPQILRAQAGNALIAFALNPSQLEQ
jgi:hypothetical protein